MKSTDNDPTEYRFIQAPTERQILQIIDIYRTQGWWQSRDNDRDRLISRLITGSHCFLIATDGDTIIGMGRAISDGVSDAYIQDLTVLTEYRKQGIGGKILKAILKRLRTDGISWIGLIAESGSSDLYRHGGFREMHDAVPMLMIEDQ